MNDQQFVTDLIEQKRQNFIDISDQIWEYSETKYEEVQSAALLCQALEEEGFHVERKAGGIETALVGSYGEGKPVIAFLGEFDALSGLSQKAGVPEKDPLVHGGNGHGCGHNLLGAGSLAAAVAVRHYLEQTGQKGTVRYYGCPAEEGGGGRRTWPGPDCLMMWTSRLPGIHGMKTWHTTAGCSLLARCISNSRE